MKTLALSLLAYCAPKVSLIDLMLLLAFAWSVADLIIWPWT